jgi:hypothetical protein
MEIVGFILLVDGMFILLMLYLLYNESKPNSKRKNKYK